jgi:hypothetical protein
MVHSTVRGSEHYDTPFTIGHVFSNGPFVHVLDELTLEVLLRELDTISDLTQYFERKEVLLSNAGRSVMAVGEEQLIATYLTHIGADGQHGFAHVPDNKEGVCIDEGHWERFVQNPQYQAKKRADEQSYTWDRLIEHFVPFGAVRLDEERNQEVAALEPALRVLAAETRLARRHLASQLIDARQKEVRPGQRFLRLGLAYQSPDTAYVFLVVP